MGTDRISISVNGRRAAGSLLTCLAAGTILFTAALALAQEAAKGSAPPPAEPPGFFGGIMQWFDRQASGIGSNLKGAGSQVENFSNDASAAAKSTVDGAKDAAGAVVKIPAARVVNGHERCALAPNGAPDCVAAANAMCKTKGFDAGKSVDMTTAEICPAQVYLSGRNSGEGCHTETFVSRAFCQ